MIAYVLPTRDRPDELCLTLAALGSLPPHDAEVIVVDNASASPARVPARLSNGLPARALRMGENLGAAARNQGVRATDPASEWIVMLDDDSSPEGLGVLAACRDAPSDVLAIQAEIGLGSGVSASAARESGGLPEVFIGCGAAVRRSAFLSVGGYDPAFGYYAEEYDLCARLLLAGGRVAMDRRFFVSHRKVKTGRDMNTILHRLVRNNGWVVQRYAPRGLRREELRHTITRYQRIAGKERALSGFDAGFAELVRTLRHQTRRELPAGLWDRFTGRSAARRSLLKAYAERPFSTAALVREGKNAHEIVSALDAMGVAMTTPEEADVLVIGTLSPGPMLDAWDALRETARRVLAPWSAIVADPTGERAERPEWATPTPVRRAG